MAQFTKIPGDPLGECIYPGSKMLGFLTLGTWVPSGATLPSRAFPLSYEVHLLTDNVYLLVPRWKVIKKRNHSIQEGAIDLIIKKKLVFLLHNGGIG